MAGIGKTTLAKQIFEDPDIVERFESRVWVRVGRKKCTFNKIARWILAQLSPDSDKFQEDEEVSQDLQICLKSKRCFIVLDDVWEAGVVVDILENLRASQVLLITRQTQVATMRISQPGCYITMELLNKEESWHLFCAQVFAEELCPSELVKPGKKIVEKCEGFPLLIVTIAHLLSSVDRNLENWNKVAEDKRNRLLKDACKEIEEVLFPSYDNLRQFLKICFLYMGVFPQDYEVPISNILNLWTAEGFLEEKDEGTTLEYSTVTYLHELLWNNVLLVYKCSSRSSSSIVTLVKTCGLHCSFWHLCNREAEKTKFFHVFNYLEDGLEEGIKGHRRLCIHNNVLFGIKDVYSSIERVCASTARSLLCFGPYHQYEIPMCFGLRLLRILDAPAIRFYDFPLDVLKLVLLRYLALTCNGRLPPSITKLFKLQVLIVGRHLSIKSSGARAPSYMPMEIWHMKELQHLQIMGSDLPDPCGLRLLRILDAPAIRFYDFPLDVLKLVLLRYLALTCNGRLPPSITKLFKLQVLIVGRHLSIKSSGARAPSYVPMEIWHMKELQHLQIMGSDLPDPCGERLPKLLRLKGVSAHSCNKEVLEGIPNLQKLGILIELEPNATEPLHCFDHISNLSKLESLTCVTVNPMFVTAPAAAPLFMFPSSIKKLHLSGLAYPWEYMNTIAATLPNLQELKLRCYAFRGPTWEIKRNSFPKLAFLLIEDTGLVQWKAARDSFPRLSDISMNHCYSLQELHLENCDFLKKIVLDDCNPVAVNYVLRKIDDESITNSRDGFFVRCSWNDGNLKSSQEDNRSKRKFYRAR